MRRPAILAASLLALTACEPTVDSYVEDHKAREEKLRECAAMGVMVAKEDEYCRMAMEAQGIVLKQSAKNLMNAITLQSGDEEETAEQPAE